MNPKIPAPLLAMTRWIDSWAGVDHSVKVEDRGMDWLRTAPFLAVHAVCLLVIWVGWSWTAVAVAAALYLVRMFAITGFYHRYFAHRTFKTSRTWQFLMGVWASTAAQRGPLWWAGHHRHHHRYSDEEDDVHSPHQHGIWWSHMGWITSKCNFRTRLEYVKDLAHFPELRFLDRFDILIPVVMAFGLFGFGIFLNWQWPSLGTSGLQMVVWGFFISTVVLFHGTCTINSLAHLFGRKRYRTGDHSRNSFLLALITLGEGWHNNHHHYPAATRQGFYWWEIDITYYGLRVLSWLGLIWDLKGVPSHVREAETL